MSKPNPVNSPLLIVCRIPPSASSPPFPLKSSVSSCFLSLCLDGRRAFNFLDLSSPLGFLLAPLSSSAILLSSPSASFSSTALLSSKPSIVSYVAYMYSLKRRIRVYEDSTGSPLHASHRWPQTPQCLQAGWT